MGSTPVSVSLKKGAFSEKCGESALTMTIGLFLSRPSSPRTLGSALKSFVQAISSIPLKVTILFGSAPTRMKSHMSDSHDVIIFSDMGNVSMDAATENGESEVQTWGIPRPYATLAHSGDESENAHETFLPLSFSAWTWHLFRNESSFPSLL